MSKKLIKVLALMVIVGVMSVMSSQEHIQMGALWLFILLLGYLKLKNNFINLLLLMEYAVMLALFLSMNYIGLFGLSSSLVFSLMSLSVGEAVLGLALLVRNSRVSNKEFLSLIW